MNNADRLPDSYAKDKNSNNYKLLKLNEDAIATLNKDMYDVLNVLDIKNATGNTLELYGDMVGQKRGELNDTQYRYMILTRIGMNIARGNYDSIIAICQMIFDCNPQDIILNDSEKPCRVEVTKFPLKVLVDAGFSSNQAIAMVELLMPIGVTIENANFEGTFEFAETATEYDENAGFGNIEQTIGGYMGLSLGSDDIEPVLPI